MRNLIIFTILLSAFLFAVSPPASAQACGAYTTNVYVRDDAGKPIENAVVQLVPITKDETKGKNFRRDETDLSNFKLTLTEGHSLNEFHRLIISADGFKTAENELQTVSCNDLKIIVKLAQSDSPDKAVWNFENRIVINATNENGREVEHAALKIKKDGKVVDQLEIRLGYLSFGIKSGVYEFQIEEKGFQTQNIKIDATKIAGQYLKVKLKKSPAAVLSGTVKFKNEIVKGADVLLRDEYNNEYRAKTDENGRYKINLPFGKYFVYSAINSACVLCVEYYQHDFLINKEGEINLDIEVRFMGEG